MAIKTMNTSAAGGEPAASTLLERAAQRGHNPGTVTAALLRLLDRYGAAALEAAIVSALAQGVPPSIIQLKTSERGRGRESPDSPCIVFSRPWRRRT